MQASVCGNEDGPRGTELGPRGGGSGREEDSEQLLWSALSTSCSCRSACLSQRLGFMPRLCLEAWHPPLSTPYNTNRTNNNDDNNNTSRCAVDSLLRSREAGFSAGDKSEGQGLSQATHMWGPARCPSSWATPESRPSDQSCFLPGVGPLSPGLTLVPLTKGL